MIRTTVPAGEAELNRQHACSFGGGGIVRAPGVARAHSSARRQGPEPCEVVTSLSVALRDQLAKAARVQAPRRAGLGDGLNGTRLDTVVEDVFALVRPLLPCDRCPRVEIVIARLGRLGKLARHVLLGASPAAADPCVVEPPRPGRAAAVAHRRATHQLAVAGLVSLTTSPTGRLAVRRSPLGQGIVERLGDALRAGQRIRWSRHRQGLLAAVRRPIPELLDDLRRSVAEAKRARLELIALLAAFRRPPDPQRLEDRAIHMLDLVLAALVTANGRAA